MLSFVFGVFVGTGLAAAVDSLDLKVVYLK